MRSIILFWKNHNGSMPVDIAKVAVAIAFMSVIAAQVASNQTSGDRERLARASAAVSQGHDPDPLITGSLRKTANESRLDPCIVSR